MSAPVMRPDVDWESVTHIDLCTFVSPEEQDAFDEVADEAARFICSHKWCGKVIDLYVGHHTPGVVSVFLVHIQPGAPGVDDWLWLVVGDVPPAYLVLDKAKTPDMAIHAYVREMRRWVDAVNSGSTTRGLIPVNVPPTRENGSALAVRLDLLERAFQKEGEEGAG